MNTENHPIEVASLPPIVRYALLVLLAGSVACGAAPGDADDGVDSSTSAIQPSEQAPRAPADTDAAPPDEEPTGQLPEQPSSIRGAGAPIRGDRPK